MVVPGVKRSLCAIITPLLAALTRLSYTQTQRLSSCRVLGTSPVQIYKLMLRVQHEECEGVVVKVKREAPVVFRGV